MSDILQKPAFQYELEEISAQSGTPITQLREEAVKDLAEMSSSRNPLAARGFAALGRFVYRRGYHPEPVYDLDELERVNSESRKRSIVFLVTHKTYLDFFVLYDFLYRRGVSTPYIFGGLNMNFAGFGALARRAGGIFIRRTFKDDPVYKSVLRRYIESLVEEGSCFMWAIEGTRSRTGKLLQPKMGLLNYVSRVSQTLGDDAISYIPVSVVYDQIPDVVDMAAQEAGAEKKQENLSWFMKYIRGLGGSFGSIYIRFGDPMTISDTPDAPDFESSHGQVGKRQIELQKLAFEACYRINEITPATTTSLVLMVLLCRGSCDERQIRSDLSALNTYIRNRTEQIISNRPSRALARNLKGSIDLLVANGVIRSSSADVPRQLFEIAPDRVSVAIYYSNMAVHHFVISAFVELALISLAQSEGPRTEAGLEAEFRRLRDLFKFEFFFSRQPVFEKQLRHELDLLNPQWRSLLEKGSNQILSILEPKPILVAAGVLSPFVAAYQVVAEMISDDPASRELTDKEFIASCLEAGQSRRGNTSPLSIPGLSRALLANGLHMADHRGLRADNSPETDQKRVEFIRELETTKNALDTLNTIARRNAAV